MSLFSALRDGYYNRNSKSRKARRGLDQFWSIPSRPARALNISLVEMLENRQLMAAYVSTDQLDYAPGSIATFTASNDTNLGKNFTSGEIVRFQVTRTDGVADFPNGNLPWGVKDNYTGDAFESEDINGKFMVYPDQDPSPGVVKATWDVEQQYAGAALLLTATGQESKAEATKAFTDAADANVASVSVGSRSGSITYGTSGFVTFEVTTNNVSTQTGNKTATLKLNETLPTGVTGGIVPATANFGTNQHSFTSQLTFQASSSALAGSYNFTVTASGVNSVTSNTFILIISAKTITANIVASSKVTVHGLPQSFRG